MSINEEQNIKFLKKSIEETLNESFIEFNDFYSDLIETRVLINTDIRELKTFWKFQFDNLLERSGFSEIGLDKILLSSVFVDNNTFKVRNFEPLLNHAKELQLHLIEPPFKSGTEPPRENEKMLELFYEDLEFILEKCYIKHQLFLLDAKKITSEGEIIFLNTNHISSEGFFRYIIDNWLKNETNKKTALNCVFYNLWYKNNNNISFKIKCSITDFARYFDKHFSDILKIDIKKPKLNEFTDTKESYYQNKFKFHLDNYQGLNNPY